MRNLSRESETVSLFVPRVLARIIGYFSGFDLHLEKGDTFIDYGARGHTSYQLENLRFYIGKNYNIHRYKITRVTPKSYVLQYLDSEVNIIHPIRRNTSHKFIRQFNSKFGKSRVFPFRRSDHPDWVSTIRSNQEHLIFLDEYIHVREIRDNFVISF